MTRDSKRLPHALKNPKFDISKFKEKGEDIEFYTGLPHWDALMLLYDMLHDKAQNLNYGSYAKKNTSPEQNLGSYNPGQNLLRQIAKMPIFSCHPSKN